MSTAATSGRAMTPVGKFTPNLTAKALASTAILAVAIAFVWKYVFRYYLNYNQSAFTDPNLGAPNYWNDRFWLLLHMSGGTIALLAGPWQFWTGFRSRYFRLHRATGLIFLTGVGLGCIGAYHMVMVTTFGWAFGFGILMLATAWFTTTAMAYYAILKRRIQVHKEWMVRAYVVTFAFVTFRLLNDYGPTSRVQPANDRAITIAWACWALPLLVTEVILQLRKMRSATGSA